MMERLVGGEWDLIIDNHPSDFAFADGAIVKNTTVAQLNFSNINLLIEKIVLYDDKVEIFFHAPMRKAPDQDRGLSFYSFTAILRYQPRGNRPLCKNRVTVDMKI